MLLREANVTDGVSNTVKGVLTVLHTSPRSNQLDESGVVNSEMTVSQVLQEPAQSQGPGVVVRDTLTTRATVPDSKSRNVVVRRVKRTRRILRRPKALRKE